MNREEQLRRLETYPLTENQLGAIMGEFERLGFHKQTARPWHVRKDELWLGRNQRLDITSCLVERDVDSTKELKMGEAGKLYEQLRYCETLDDLFDLLPKDFELIPADYAEDDMPPSEEILSLVKEQEEYSLSGLGKYVAGLFRQWGS